MRKLFYLLFLMTVSFGFSAAEGAEPGNVRIDFVHPERFTDFRIQGRDENASVPIFRNEISSFLSPVVAKHYPGETMTLRFTDIDLGGRLGNRPRFNDTRFNHEWGPPIRLSFEYSVTDSKGSVVAHGSKNLLAQDYVRLYSNYPDSLKTSPVFYEKATLSNWVSGREATGSILVRD
jgi:Protein of unknown function (DUF3016)